MLFIPESFPGFGPNSFDLRRNRAELARVSGSKPAVLRAGVRADCPREPGVYGMLDPRGRLIYVGKAKNLRARLMSYFRPGSREPKAGRIIAQTRQLIWEQGPNEFAALLRELELIRRFRPAYNVMGQPGRRRIVYLVIGRPPVSYCYLSRELPKATVGVFGPLPGARRLGDCVRRLNDLFQLRDCPQSQIFRFADQKELFPVIEPAGCLRYEIGTCSGPCVAAVTRASYARNVRRAKAFLDGLDDSLLHQLQTEMESAAASFAYERAAGLRDRIEDLRWLQERLAWLQQARREYSFVYSVITPSGREIWYLIRAGRVWLTTAAPHDARTRKSAVKALDAVFPTKGGPSVVPGEHFDHVLLVAAWFRRYPAERQRVIDLDRARGLCSPASLIA
ncbi:MAG: UvrB/UvrC motif-containing protein [Gemmataceae bacterium]